MRSATVGADPSITGALAAAAERRPVVSFLAGTFAWSWGYWAIVWLAVGPTQATYLHTLPGLWGPAIAGLLVARACGAEPLAIVSDAGDRRANARWYAIGIGVVTALGLVAPLSQATAASTGLSTNLVAWPVTLAVAVFAGGSEEFGWRGLAHPQLRQRYGLVGSGLAIGVVWALWHLPIRALVETGQPVWLFVAGLLPLSVLFGWLYDASGGSVLAAVLAHAAADAPSLVEPAGDVSRSVVLRSEVGAACFYVLVVGAIVVARRRGR